MPLDQRADYDDGTLRASVRISRLSAGTPISYVLVAFHNINGPFALDKSNFRTIPEAMAYATKFGFQAHLWSVTPL